MAQTDDALKVTIEGKIYNIDDFELGDLEWLEEYLGTTLDDAAALSSMKAAVGFVYLIKRRENPEFTVEDARKIKLSVFSEPAPNGNGSGGGQARKRPTRKAAAAR